jgi:hypothetical protein
MRPYRAKIGKSIKALKGREIRIGIHPYSKTVNVERGFAPIRFLEF